MRRADGAFRLRQDHRDKACQRACAVLLSRSFQREREDRRQGHIKAFHMGDRVFGTPIPALPLERDKALDKVKEPPRTSRSLEREER